MSDEVIDIQTESDSATQTSSYRSIFKATSLFGGVQVYQILIQLVKSKFVAVLLGPLGVGIIGLYQSGIQLIQSLTSMGLASSAVRDVSEANGSRDQYRIAKVITVVRRLVWITGLLGLIVVAFCAPLLSQISFGNKDYTVPFIILSITLLFDQISAGQKVVLQGLRKLKELAKCSAIGATFGLVVSVPLYYWLGVKGILPTLFLNSLCALVVSWLYSRRIKLASVTVTPSETIQQGKQMLVMGLSMSASAILTTAVAYVIKSFIQNDSGVKEVGLYQAGFVIMNTYVGLIFNAISTDFYPRLAAVNKDNNQCSILISQQGEIATMILAPMLSFCLIFMPFILKILYSEEFTSANGYIIWACLGMMFRMSSWVVSYIFVAKAEAKLFMINEIAASFYTLFFSLFGYRIAGLRGLGIAFFLAYFAYNIQVYLIARKKYSFNYSKDFLIGFSLHLIIVLSCLTIAELMTGWQRYLIGIIAVGISIAYGFCGLNKKMDIIGALRARRKL